MGYSVFDEIDKIVECWIGPAPIAWPPVPVTPRATGRLGRRSSLSLRELEWIRAREHAGPRLRVARVARGKVDPLTPRPEGTERVCARSVFLWVRRTKRNPCSFPGIRPWRCVWFMGNI